MSPGRHAFALLVLLVGGLVAGCAAKDGDKCNPDKPDCPPGNLCWLRPGDSSGAKCVTSAAANDGCKQTEGCKQSGECTFNSIGGGICEPTSETDCRRSALCTKSGECTFKDGVCLVGSDADCAQSEDCKTMKRCVLNAEALKPECMVPVD